jgi:hypothetical protein
MADFLRGFIASFRNLCLDPPMDVRLIFSGLNQLRLLLTAARNADETIDKNGHVVG